MEELNDIESLEKRLKESLFVEYLNCYLSLPNFPTIVQYNLVNHHFEEIIREGEVKDEAAQDAIQVDHGPSVTSKRGKPTIYGDNYISKLNKKERSQWIINEKIPSFIRSDLFSEYKLCKLLAEYDATGLTDQRSIHKLPNVSKLKTQAYLPTDTALHPLAMSSKVHMTNFKIFLEGTIGENDYSFWIECDHLKRKQGKQLKLELSRITQKYSLSGSKSAITKSRFMKINEPISLDIIIELQNQVLESLKSYWCKRFLYKEVLKDNIKNLETNENGDRPQSKITNGRQSAMNHSQMEMLKDTDTVKSPIFFSPASPSHVPLSCSTPNQLGIDEDAKTHQFRSLSVIPFLPKISEITPSHEVRPHSKPNTLSLDSKNRRCQSVPLPICCNSRIEKEVDVNVIDNLWKCLAIEYREPGGIFEQYILKAGNNLWNNCLNCWKEIQDFKEGFIMEDFNPYQVEEKARHIFSKFILRSGSMYIQCSSDIVSSISRQLYPAYEELFDSIEEIILLILAKPWKNCLEEENNILDQITRSWEGEASLQLAELDDNDNDYENDDDDKFVEELCGEDHDIIDDKLIDKYQDEKGYKNIPSRSSTKTATPQGHRIQQVTQDITLLQLFKNFLLDRHASVDLMFWMEIESFRKIPISESKMRNAKAKVIRSTYFTKSYLFGANSPASKEAQRRMVALGGDRSHKLPKRPSTPVLIEAQKQVQSKLERRWLPVFVKTAEYLTYADPSQLRNNKKIAFGEPLMQQSGEDQEDWKSKVLEKRWMTNSKDIVQCRKVMINSESPTCKQFEIFMSIKSSKDERLVADLHFWQEIQRFKELCHVHTPEIVLQMKVDAICSCFIVSKILPKIQVDITHEMADKLLKKSKVSPYMFREIQNELFRVLFSYWMEFCAFRDQRRGNEVDFALVEMKRQLDAKEAAKLQKLSEFQQTKDKRFAHFKVFPLSHQDDDNADLMFRLEEAKDKNSGISAKKKRENQVTFAKLMA